MHAFAQRLDEEAVSLGRPSAVRCELPALAKGGVVVSCPHSGRFYPPELLASSSLDRFALRRSEDAFVDLLLADSPKHGAILLVNEFARAFVDVNRGPDELDPKLIHELASTHPDSKSERVRAGLGVIPRTVGDGLAIYDQPMSHQEAQARLDEVHRPWHNAIERSLARARHENGACILLDCHSMPNNIAGEPVCDVILGDRFGASCAPVIMNEATVFLRSAGLRVMRNDPFAGGYTTIRHGHPVRNDHALQIEINRSIYMVEGAMTLRPSFQAIGKVMAGLVSALVTVTEKLGIA